MLYVFGTNRFPGWGFEGDLGIDGRWVGAVTRGRDYFVLPISPGEHHLCARVVSRTGPFLIPALKTDDTSNYFLKAKPGETYYLTLRVGRHSGFLQLLDSGKGKRLLASSTFTTSRIK